MDVFREAVCTTASQNREGILFSVFSLLSSISLWSSTVLWTIYFPERQVCFTRPSQWHRERPEQLKRSPASVPTKQSPFTRNATRGVSWAITTMAFVGATWFHEGNNRAGQCQDYCGQKSG